LSSRNKKEKRKSGKFIDTSKAVLSSGIDLTRGIIYELTTYSKESVTSQYGSLKSALNNSKKIDMPTREEILTFYKFASEPVNNAKDKTFTRTVVLTNAILASDFSRNMSRWLEGMTEGAPTVYDKAMDAAYIATKDGGGKLHRLFDGSHTLWGAWDKVQDALPDDTFAQEVIGYTQSLLKDVTQPK
jgi:hypothetical protein